MTQRITDVLLNNYSPVAFVNGDLDKFADNYITVSNERIDTWFNKFYKNEDRAAIIKNVEKLMNRANEEFVEEEINDEPEEIDEDDIDDIENEIEEAPEANSNDMEDSVERVQHISENREKIAVDLSTASETKADAPKTEAPNTEAVKARENNPLKERIVLDEFSAKASDKDLSAKVDKKDAPVASNVKE
jgi:hypothetical protein